MGRFRRINVEGLREVAALDLDIATDDRLISSSASCANHSARLPSSAESLSSVNSVSNGSGSRRGPWDSDENLLGVTPALAEFVPLNLGASCDIVLGLKEVVGFAWEVAGTVKLQEEVAKYGASRLFINEYAVNVSLLEI